MHVPELWQIALTILTADFLRYFLAAGFVFFLLWKLLSRRLAHRRVVPDYPAGSELRREFAYSVLTVLIFAANGVLIFVLTQTGVMEVYADAAERGWTYWWLSLAAIVLLHDAYFYATHRLMHRRELFAHVHAVHHRSRNPSPWAAYAFHPFEAAVQAAFLPTVLLVIPLHGGVIGVFLIHMILRNVLGHCGFELYPRSAANHAGWRLLTSTTHHHLHHQAAKGNYGLYFTWWDRWSGTEQAGYRETLAAITSRDPAGARS